MQLASSELLMIQATLLGGVASVTALVLIQAVVRIQVAAMAAEELAAVPKNLTEAQ